MDFDVHSGVLALYSSESNVIFITSLNISAGWYVISNGPVAVWSKGELRCKVYPTPQKVMDSFKEDNVR